MSGNWYRDRAYIRIVSTYDKTFQSMCSIRVTISARQTANLKLDVRLSARCRGGVRQRRAESVTTSGRK
eukprot:568325-Pleurochrysis_carterae.AAC.1